MLEAEAEAVLTADEVGVGVAPCVQVGAAAKRLAELGAAALAHVVDDGDGDVVLSLQVTEQAEEAGDVGCAVLVEAVQAHEGVEQEQGGAQSARVASRRCIGLEVEAQARQR